MGLHYFVFDNLSRIFSRRGICLLFIECMLHYLFPEKNWLYSIPPEESEKDSKLIRVCLLKKVVWKNLTANMFLVQRIPAWEYKD
jgi:hypothetical protein